jgi:hypothetical protein
MPLDGCSWAVNVDSLPQSSYPSSPLKDRDLTLTGLHHYRNLLFAILTLPLVYGSEITTCRYKGLL